MHNSVLRGDVPAGVKKSGGGLKHRRGTWWGSGSGAAAQAGDAGHEELDVLPEATVRSTG